MSKSIESRLEKIEKMLSIGKEERQFVFILRRSTDRPFIDSLGPIEQWETYKQATTGCNLVFFRADPQKEIEARKNQKAIE
ncbi:MAG: hypothetical protein ABSB11_04890 [Sedimentisphaerales bacterium]|jgi:hypothetical protein